MSDKRTIRAHCMRGHKVLIDMNATDDTGQLVYWQRQFDNSPFSSIFRQAKWWPSPLSAPISVISSHWGIQINHKQMKKACHFTDSGKCQHQGRLKTRESERERKLSIRASSLSQRWEQLHYDHYHFIIVKRQCTQCHHNDVMPTATWKSFRRSQTPSTVSSSASMHWLKLAKARHYGVARPGRLPTHQRKACSDKETQIQDLIMLNSSA